MKIFFSATATPNKSKKAFPDSDFHQPETVTPVSKTDYLILLLNYPL